MDKKPKRTQRVDRLEDRGDMYRRSLHENENHKPPPDRGDLNKAVDKKINNQTKSDNEHNMSQSTNTEEVKRNSKVEKTGNVEFRQRVRDRYTLKPKGILKFYTRKEEQFSYVRDELSQKEYFCKDSKDSSEPIEKAKTTPETKSERSTKLRNHSKRKPAPKASKQALKIPKVDTFVEKYIRPLQTRLDPNTIKPQKLPKKFIVKVQEKPKEFKNTKKTIHTPSPDVSQVAIVSPPTEIAKWTPASAKHTMPYYEAWVDTTLAAISKVSKQDKIYAKQKVLQSLELQRKRSPELVYNLHDERYTGKIRVRQR